MRFKRGSRVKNDRRVLPALPRLLLALLPAQREVLVISATVREVITTSALLKLPPSITRAEKLERVQSVLR